MEAVSGSRPVELRVVAGGATSGRVESDEERERRGLRRVADALRRAIREDLPATSSWLLPFQKAWRAVRDELRRRRRSE